MAGFGRPKTAGGGQNSGRGQRTKGLSSGSARVKRAGVSPARRSGGMGSGVGKGGGNKAPSAFK